MKPEEVREVSFATAAALVLGAAQIIRGKKEFLELLTAAILARGHVLIEDNPGLGKTTVAKTFAKLIGSREEKTGAQGLVFKRIQFTPDLLPYDITGVDVFDPKSRSFRFVPGPVLANIVLADEINRTTPKVQSALLEVMAERQVTIGAATHYPPEPFFVVCDFPFGLSSTASKVLQIEEICKKGGVEDLDIVANYGWIRSGKWKEVEEELRVVTNATHKYKTFIKVIFETDALTLDQVARATDVACKAGVDFVKTSTGFYTGGESKGASLEVVKVMMDAAKGRAKVKGAGGIRDQAHFFELIDMGIDRMGVGYRSTPVVLGV
ncbi:hypothetical protein FACS1894140_6690 [Spirochaetia bacterium]|nr:hypothetical protein FACS1894140_6690 [Spirochaetia bacterium]